MTEGVDDSSAVSKEEVEDCDAVCFADDDVGVGVFDDGVECTGAGLGVIVSESWVDFFRGLPIVGQTSTQLELSLSRRRISQPNSTWSCSNAARKSAMEL